MAKRNNDEDENFEYNSDSSYIQDKYFDKLEEDSDIEQIEEDENFDFLDEKKIRKSISVIKPKLMGKHSLKHDNIFKGKKQEKINTDEFIEDNWTKEAGGSFDLGEDDLEHQESRNNIEYERNIKLQKEIYNALINNTDLKFITEFGKAVPRRKAGKYDLNNYFKICITDLSNFGFTYSEIFIELSLYFSDNIWSVFEILNTEYKEIIIKELADKKGISSINKIDFF